MKSAERLCKRKIKDYNTAAALGGEFMVFKEYKLDVHDNVYDFVMTTNKLSVAKEFVKAISGVMRVYNIVVTDKEFNVLLRYPSTEVYIKS